MSNPLITKVKEIIESSAVAIFMKGTPDFPQCGFSSRACQVLRAAGVQDFASVNVLAEDALWDALEEFTRWPTVPQIFIHGKFVGGCDILVELYQNGELQRLLEHPLPVEGKPGQTTASPN